MTNLGLLRLWSAVALASVPRLAVTPERPAQWSLTVLRSATGSGGSLNVTLHAHIDRFWHLYSMTQPAGGPVAMRIALLPGAPYTLVGQIRAPAPDTIPDANFGILTQTYDDSVTLRAAVRPKGGTSPGHPPLGFTITYQTCTARYCLPARTDTVESAATLSADPSGGPSATAAVAEVKSLYFLQDFIGGSTRGGSLLKTFPASRELRGWYVANLARTDHPWDGVDEARGMLAANRTDPWGWFATAVALEYGGEVGDAATILDASREAYRRGPLHPDLIWLRALALGNNSEAASALALLDSAAKRRPLTPEQLNLVAADLYSTASVAGKVDSARRDSALSVYARVRKLEPTSITAYIGAASRLLNAGRTTEAYDLAKQAVDISPASLATHRWLSSVVQTMKNRSQADRNAELQADAERLLALRGDEPMSLQQVAQTFGSVGQPDRQAVIERRILAEFPNTVAAEWILVNRYRALDKERQDSTADSTVTPRYRKALWDFVDRPTHLQPRLLGDAYRGLFYLTDSTTAADTLLRIVHGMEQFEGINPHIIYAAGAIRLAERGVDLTEAERLARAGIPEGKKKIAGQRAAYETVGEYATAVDWMTAKMYDALGWVFFHEGQLDSAEVQLKHAADLDPKSTDALFHLGRLAEKRGSPAAAEVFYTKGSLISVLGTNPNRAALQQLYRVQHGSLDGYPNYLSHLADADRARRKDEIEKTRAADPKPLRPFALHAVDGHLVTLDSLKGKVAVINNWGMWCGPCVAEMPEFQKLAAQYAGDSTVRILAIDSRDPSVDDLRAWLRKKGYTFTTLLDDGYLARADVIEFPTTWVLDRSGQVVFKKVGWSEKLVEEFTWRIQMAR
jgi:tetratricopeptide (TPR) repeat protein/peroxiredoxin